MSLPRKAAAIMVNLYNQLLTHQLLLIVHLRMGSYLATTGPINWSTILASIFAQLLCLE
jgi:hypothetical protein